MGTCGACSAENPDGARFCNSCGSPLTGPEPREERKTVTVVFCDLVGSTSLGESRDPEAVRALLGRYFEGVRAIVERHGGTVEKFVGDAVVAVFGARGLLTGQRSIDDVLNAMDAAWKQGPA
jgi:class 3 adenylate cyclase